MESKRVASKLCLSVQTKIIEFFTEDSEGSAFFLKIISRQVFLKLLYSFLILGDSEDSMLTTKVQESKMMSLVVR